MSLPVSLATRDQWPSGFVYVEDFLTQEEQDRVIKIVDLNGFDQHVHRRQQFFGPKYYHTPQSYRADLQPVDTSLPTEILGKDDFIGNQNDKNDKSEKKNDDKNDDKNGKNNENYDKTDSQISLINEKSIDEEDDGIVDATSGKNTIGSQNLRHKIGQFDWLIEKLIKSNLFERADVRDPFVEYINVNDRLKRVERTYINKDTNPLFQVELEKLTQIRSKIEEKTEKKKKIQQQINTNNQNNNPENDNKDIDIDRVIDDINDSDDDIEWGPKDTPYPDQILVNEYTVKQNIGQHFDDQLCFGPLVVGVSCGDDCTLILSRPRCIGKADEHLRNIFKKKLNFEMKKKKFFQKITQEEKIKNTEKKSGGLDGDDENGNNNPNGDESKRDDSRGDQSVQNTTSTLINPLTTDSQTQIDKTRTSPLTTNTTRSNTSIPSGLCDIEDLDQEFTQCHSLSPEEIEFYKKNFDENNFENLSSEEIENLSSEEIEFYKKNFDKKNFQNFDEILSPEDLEFYEKYKKDFYSSDGTLLSYPISLRDFTLPSWREGQGHPLLTKYCRCTRERMLNEMHPYGKILTNLKRHQEFNVLSQYPQVGSKIVLDSYGTESFFYENVNYDVLRERDEVKMMMTEIVENEENVCNGCCGGNGGNGGNGGQNKCQNSDIDNDTNTNLNPHSEHSSISSCSQNQQTQQKCSSSCSTTPRTKNDKLQQEHSIVHSICSNRKGTPTLDTLKKFLEFAQLRYNKFVLNLSPNTTNSINTGQNTDQSGEASGRNGEGSTTSGQSTQNDEDLSGSAPATTTTHPTAEIDATTPQTDSNTPLIDITTIPAAAYVDFAGLPPYLQDLISLIFCHPPTSLEIDTTISNTLTNTQKDTISNDIRCGGCKTAQDDVISKSPTYSPNPSSLPSHPHVLFDPTCLAKSKLNGIDLDSPHILQKMIMANQPINKNERKETEKIDQKIDQNIEKNTKNVSISLIPNTINTILNHQHITTEEELEDYLFNYDYNGLLEQYYAIKSAQGKQNNQNNHRSINENLVKKNPIEAGSVDESSIQNSSTHDLYRVDHIDDHPQFLSTSNIKKTLLQLLTPNLVDINTCINCDDTLYIPVKKGSVYVLAGASRYQYRHAIKKLAKSQQKSNTDYRRVSLTVRSLLPGRRQVAKDSSMDHDLTQYNYSNSANNSKNNDSNSTNNSQNNDLSGVNIDSNGSSTSSDNKNGLNAEGVDNNGSNT